MIIVKKSFKKELVVATIQRVKGILIRKEVHSECELYIIAKPLTGSKE